MTPGHTCDFKVGDIILKVKSKDLYSVCNVCTLTLAKYIVNTTRVNAKEKKKATMFYKNSKFKFKFSCWIPSTYLQLNWTQVSVLARRLPVVLHLLCTVYLKLSYCSFHTPITYPTGGLSACAVSHAGNIPIHNAYFIFMRMTVHLFSFNRDRPIWWDFGPWNLMRMPLWTLYDAYSCIQMDTLIGFIHWCNMENQN